MSLKERRGSRYRYAITPLGLQGYDITPLARQWYLSNTHNVHERTVGQQSVVLQYHTKRTISTAILYKQIIFNKV
jgi:hypothetical protein